MPASCAISTRQVPRRASCGCRVVQQVPSSFMARRPNSGRSLLSQVSSQPPSTSRTSHCLASRVSLCSALGTRAWQARRGTDAGSQLLPWPRALAYRQSQTCCLSNSIEALRIGHATRARFGCQRNAFVDQLSKSEASSLDDVIVFSILDVVKLRFCPPLCGILSDLPLNNRRPPGS